MTKKAHEHILVHSEFNKIPWIIILMYIVLPIFGVWYFITSSGTGMSMAVAQPAGAAARGKILAAKQGCFYCHGPEGKGGVENPTHPDLKVPAWDGDDMVGNNMFYPILLRQEIEHAIIPTMFSDPADIGGQEYSALKMQPWIGRLTATQIRDIMAYIYSINPGLQAKMLNIIYRKPDKELTPFSEVSGDINSGFPKNPNIPAVTVSGLVMGTPGVQQMPGRIDYPDTYDEYIAEREKDKIPQYYYDVKEFADLIGLKY